MFQPKPHTIVNSIVQRSLLKWWEDQRAGRIAPPRSEIDPHGLARYWSDIAVFEVVRTAGRARYRFRSHGRNLLLADGADHSGRYLDELLPAPFAASVMAAYDAILDLKCPLYTVRPANDAGGTALTIERLLLPLSARGGTIDDLLIHVQMFCPEGRYQRQRLFEASITYKDYLIQAAILPAAARVAAHG